MGLGITLTNNEIKDITKVSRFLKNRGCFLKRTTKNTFIQERGWCNNFVGSLMKFDLPLMKKMCLHH